MFSRQRLTAYAAIPFLRAHVLQLDITDIGIGRLTSAAVAHGCPGRWVRCRWRCSSVQCATRGRPAPGPPPDARIPTTDVTTSHTPARARILLVLRCLLLCIRHVLG